MNDNNKTDLNDMDISNNNGFIQCDRQLSTRKKIRNGFNIDDSVIDVEQGGYAVTSSDDTLFTFGIGPCCGIVAFDDEKKVLFHLDGQTQPEEVLKQLKELKMKEDTTILVAPGASCGVKGSFLYEKFEEESQNMGYSVQEYKIPCDLGFVTVSKNQIIIGSAFDHTPKYTFDIPEKKTSIIKKIVEESCSRSDFSKLGFLESIIFEKNTHEIGGRY